MLEKFLLFCLTGQSKTMFGSVSSPGDLGAIPCAISWLFKGINERRQKSGARFSVRVSALGVNATKPGSSSKDLLAAHKTGTYIKIKYMEIFFVKTQYQHTFNPSIQIIDQTF